MGTLVQMDEPRKMLCLEVAWEIDAIARVLPELVPNNDEDHGQHFVVRALAGRLMRLSHALIGAFDGDAESAEELEALGKIVTLDGGQG